jgi:tetratricopeptide (TPR) repeat protein
VALLPILIVLSYFFYGDDWKKLIRRFGPWILMAGAMFLITRIAQSPKTAKDYPPFGRFVIFGDTLWFYVSKMFVPTQLGPDYARYPEIVLQAPLTLLWAVLPCFLVAVLASRKSLRPYLLAFAIFVAGILPVAGLVPFAGQAVSTVADRYMYFPMLGAAFAFGWWASGQRSRYRRVIAVALLSGFALKSAFQVQLWEDSYKLLSYNLSVHPASVQSRLSIATEVGNRGRFKEALALLYESLEIKPCSAAYNDIGIALAQLHQPKQAEEAFLKAIEMDPESSDALGNLGELRKIQGRKKESIALYRHALEVNPDDLKAQQALSTLGTQ